MPITLDLTGQRFGRLTVLAFHDRVERSATLFRRWMCRCDCGVLLPVVVGALRSGNTKSCGCYKNDALSERKRTHGLTGTPEYRVWQGMLRRCETPTNKNYPDYGGRGIQVCERWHSFEPFLEDMGPRATAGMTIERENNAGNYEPANCFWMPRALQNCNQRRRKDNTSGVTGVVWSEQSGRWSAFIGHKGRRIHLGLFDDIPSAAAVRQQAMRDYGFNPGHGSAE